MAQWFDVLIKDKPMPAQPQNSNNNASTQSSQFPYGHTTTLDSDRIGNYLEEHRVTNMCIDERTLERITRYVSLIQQQQWRLGPYVCNRQSPCDLLRVVRTKHGWRAQQRVPRKGPYHTLSHMLADLPMLFPTREAAIAAVEVFHHGQHFEIAYLEWRCL